MSRPDVVDNVASNSPGTSAWANSVADAINETVDDLYGASQLELPWAQVTGAPATFPPTVGAVTAATGYGIAAANGAAATASRSDHLHGTPALPTAAAIGAPLAFDSPATADGGKRIYVGTAEPTGANEGDIWIKG